MTDNEDDNENVNQGELNFIEKKYVNCQSKKYCKTKTQNERTLMISKFSPQAEELRFPLFTFIKLMIVLFRTERETTQLG